MSVDIPDKSYFKIGEVSRIVGVEPYNIRYWESQFRSIRPSKTKSNQRLYRRREIDLLLRIKSLLYNEGYTIAGAKKRLKEILAEEAEGGGAEASGDLGLSTEERRAYDAKLAEAHGELEELHARVEQLSSELDEVRADEPAPAAPPAPDLSAQLANLTAKLERAELERARLAEALHESELQRAALERDAAEAAANGVAAVDSAEVDALREDLERLRSERDEARAALEAAGADRDEARAALEAAEAERDEARVERDEAQQGREDARQERAEAVQMRVRLERQVAHLEESLASATRERDAKRAELEALQTRLTTSELDAGRLRALENERATLAGRLEAMQVEMTRLKRALETTQITLEQRDAKRVALAAAIRAELAPLLRIGE